MQKKETFRFFNKRDIFLGIVIFVFFLTSLHVMSYSFNYQYLQKAIFMYCIFTLTAGLFLGINIKEKYAFLVSIPPALVVTILWMINPSWIKCNIIGVIFMLYVFICAPVITLKTVIIICVGMFFYDIVVVYFLDVMGNMKHTVIKNHLPLIIKIPKSIGVFSLIGLGDIIIPGYLIRTEFYRSKEYNMPKICNLPLMPLVLLLGHISGLVAAVCAFKIFNHIQPALLFIIPFMLISLFMAYYKTGMLYKPLVKKPVNQNDQRFTFFRPVKFYNI